MALAQAWTFEVRSCWDDGMIEERLVALMRELYVHRYHDRYFDLLSDLASELEALGF